MKFLVVAACAILSSSSPGRAQDTPASVVAGKEQFEMKVLIDRPREPLGSHLGT